MIYSRTGVVEIAGSNSVDQVSRAPHPCETKQLIRPENNPEVLTNS
jgi:hypothetical protein